AFRGRDLAAAKDYLQRARNASKSGNDMGRAITWLAFIGQGSSEAIDVESLYRNAISMEDVDSADQTLSTEMFARFLRTQNRVDEAEALEQHAKAARKSLAAAFSAQAAVAGATKMAPGMTAPSLIRKIEPWYSEEARALKYQGTVVLQITVDVDGVAKDV